VMTYNVRYFAHKTRGITSTAAGIRGIATGIASLDPAPDIICLQEVETKSIRSRVGGGQENPGTQLDHLMVELEKAQRKRHESTRYIAYYFPAHAYKLGRETNIYTTGLAVLARESLKVLDHNAGRPHDITHRTRLVRLKQTRVAAQLAFEQTNGERFEIFNTHLSLPSFFKKEFWTGKARLGYGKNQLEEAKLLANFIDKSRKCEHFIVAGDFNSLPGSPVDAYLREQRGFVEARRTVAGSPPEIDSAAFSTAGFMNLRMHIDHLYGSPTVEWIDMEGTHGFDKKGAFSGLSDHVPLVARFRVASEA